MPRKFNHIVYFYSSGIGASRNLIWFFFSIQCIKNGCFLLLLQVLWTLCANHIQTKRCEWFPMPLYGVFCFTATVLTVILQFGFAILFLLTPTWITVKDKWSHFLSHVSRPERWLHKCQNNSASINAWRQGKCTWIYFWLVNTHHFWRTEQSCACNLSSMQTPAIALICFYGFKSLQTTPVMQLTVMPPERTLVTTPYLSGSLQEILSQNQQFWFPELLNHYLKKKTPLSVWYFFDDGLKKKRVWVGVMKYLHAKEEKCEFWVFRIKH